MIYLHSWSFGVLLYEMYSFAAVPYADVPVKQLKQFLNNGQRLHRPTYADKNMYSIQINSLAEFVVLT
jgi:hypothetical protein